MAKKPASHEQYEKVSLYFSKSNAEQMRAYGLLLANAPKHKRTQYITNLLLDEKDSKQNVIRKIVYKQLEKRICEAVSKSINEQLKVSASLDSQNQSEGDDMMSAGLDAVDSLFGNMSYEDDEEDDN